ncbi:2,3-bisphosphoglycerate-dependent phosphoglycerate mutase, partial [Paenibacillus larvae]
MIKLVLIRHGQSIWNLENRFTGWTDVDLSPNGLNEAREAGIILRKNGFSFDIAYTSVSKDNKEALGRIIDNARKQGYE